MATKKRRLFSGLGRLAAWLAPGVFLSAAAFYGFSVTDARTSTVDYCRSCHVHPQATESWKRGPHFQTRSGMQVGCTDCHLPPGGVNYYLEKARAGTRDLVGYYFGDPSAIDWEARSALELAVNYTFERACTRCHAELFPRTLTGKGTDAHLHYRKHQDELRCINCHLHTGHFHEAAPAAAETEVSPPPAETAPRWDELAPGVFADYTEVISGTGVRFEMVAVEGGRFMLGSPPDESGREPDEGPRRETEVSDFWIGKFEVTWDEYDAFYAATATRGKNIRGLRTDAVTGPTPPYGSPDQGWGKGRRPAVTMTHYAAGKYAQWLSEVTGRQYRLPTEAEWEYACRAGSAEAYFFQESDSQTWFAGLFGGGVSEEELSKFAWYRANSRFRTHPAGSEKQPNPLGLFNMLGNVKEFCLDFYAEDAYARYPDGVVRDPRGPKTGEEHVVRGGSFKSQAEELRSAHRDHTRTRQWLKTDPQTPKSVWWYSDNNEVGFRVVRPRTDVEALPADRRNDQ